MKLNRFGTFTLGVLVTAISVGAVSYANAAGDATIKSCANKKTGAMRYISKGACKKTEKLLSWNQMGSQGLPGAVGTNGPDGSKGDAGAAGTNGQNLHLIDSTGRDFGMSLGVVDGGQRASIVYDGGIWTIDSGSNFPSGAISSGSFYSDSSCSTPLAHVYGHTTMSRGWNGSEVTPKYWKPMGDSFLMSTKVVYGKTPMGIKPNVTYSCTASTDSIFRTAFQDEGNPRLIAVEEIAPPPFTAPFTIVAK